MSFSSKKEDQGSNLKRQIRSILTRVFVPCAESEYDKIFEGSDIMEQHRRKHHGTVPEPCSPSLSKGELLVLEATLLLLLQFFPVLTTCRIFHWQLYFLFCKFSFPLGRVLSRWLCSLLWCLDEFSAGGIRMQQWLADRLLKILPRDRSQGKETGVWYSGLLVLLGSILLHIFMSWLIFSLAFLPRTSIANQTIKVSTPAPPLLRLHKPILSPFILTGDTGKEMLAFSKILSFSILYLPKSLCWDSCIIKPQWLP